MSDRFVLVGAGQCAASAAITLRQRGFDDEIVMLGEEAEPPYERPPLSKGYLLGRTGADELPVLPRGWYAEHDVQLRLSSTVTAVDTGARTVYLTGGEPVRYDAALVATGGRPRRLPGIDGQRVLVLRTRRDADRLAGHLRRGEDLAILGGGFIGCEVAAAARTAGAEVTLLELQDTLLESVLGAQFGELVAGLHRRAGVRLRTGERVLQVEPGPDEVLVRTDRGVLRCGLLLVAIGLVPNVELLAGSGVACRDGVLVDAHCRTSADGLFAAGDVARHEHPLHGAPVRVEHYENAVRQGAAAAASMLGEGEPYADPHWFWSDQYEHTLQSVGDIQQFDEMVLRGTPDASGFTAFYLAGGVVRGVFGLDRQREVTLGRRMVRDRVRADPAVLRDPASNLRSVIGAQRR